MHQDRLRQGLGLCVSRQRLRLESYRRRIGDPRRLVGERQQALDELGMRLEMCSQDVLARARERRGVMSARLRNLHPAARVAAGRQRWGALQARLDRSMAAKLIEARRDLVGARGALDHLSPIGSLERGYAIVRDTNGGVVTDSGQTQTGDSVQILLHRGAIDATVVGTETKNEFEPESS